MSDSANYTSDEQQRLKAAYAEGALPDCPRCGVKMRARPIGGGSFGLGYARRREWLLCPSCHRSVLFDLRRGTRN